MIENYLHFPDQHTVETFGVLEMSNQTPPPMPPAAPYLGMPVDPRKHNHYYKNVSKFTYIDVYQVCQLFGVDDQSGALHHAIKKLLCAGIRGGGKNKTKDIREAVDSLQRYLELQE